MPSPSSAALSPRPIPGFDYQWNLLEFQPLFPDEAACADYLEKLRWPGGFVCPLCGHTKAWRTKRGLHYAGCERRISPTAGTVFAGARLPLRTLFLIVWEMVGPKVGASALNLQKTIALNRYDTAWT